MKILIVEDDLALAEAIALYLRSNNKELEIQVESDGTVAMDLVKSDTPDLIVLDILLAGQDGYEICSRIKEISNVPIIFLSNLAEEEDRVKGFLAGGDDYVTKPFSLQELLLRINARLRERGREEADVERQEESFHTFGRVALRHSALVGGSEQVQLTETEYKILLHLARNQGRAVSLEEIYKIVWGENYSHDFRTVQTHTANLRRKLEEAYGTDQYIRTQWGKGYIFQG